MYIGQDGTEPEFNKVNNIKFKVGDIVAIKKGAKVEIGRSYYVWGKRNFDSEAIFRIEEIASDVIKLLVMDKRIINEYYVVCKVDDLIKLNTEDEGKIEAQAVYGGIAMPHEEPIVSNVFYMNWVEGYNSPTKKFDKYEDAEEEAKRLAKKQDKKVYILKSVSEVETVASYIIKDIK